MDDTTLNNVAKGDNIYMKREELANLGLTDEQIEETMKLYGRDTTSLRTQLSAATSAVSKLTNEKNESAGLSSEMLDKIKKLEENLTAATSKYEELNNAFNESKKQREEEQKRTDRINRFNEATKDKAWAHSMIKEAYMNKFLESVDLDEYKGKTDGEIISDLTKDDKAAFATSQGIKLPSAKPINKGIDKAAFDKMNYSERLNLFNENPELYNSLVGKD